MRQPKTHIALLRGINVSGQKLVRMADLRQHFASCGAVNVRTYIQSGNVIFEHREPRVVTLREILERHLAGKLGYPVPTIVKSAKDFAAIAGANPYDTSLPEFGKRMYVCFFEKAPSDAAILGIQPLVTETERFVVRGEAGYAYYADGLGRAKLSGNVMERKLGLATLRNWNTVTALLAMVSPC